MHNTVARATTITLIGIEAAEVRVEAQIFGALRRFTIVGLPDGVVREAKERVRCAIESCGLSFPAAEVVVNLSPAELPKFGSGFDLAIALAILAASAQLPVASLEGRLFLGELRLDGSLLRGTGAMQAAALALTRGLGEVILPARQSTFARMIPGANVTGASSLSEVLNYLAQGTMPQQPPAHLVSPSEEQLEDFGDVVEQQAAKRALQIAAGGGHNLIMIGPPGAGKSMLSRRLNSLLPPLREQEAIEVAKIYSALPQGFIENELEQAPQSGSLTLKRSFRSPHHSTSCAALLGGGSPPRPGEVTLAHHGVLFLDELPEFRRDALEALRQPLEDRAVTISRAKQRVSLPADFLLLSAMNPCPCGRSSNEPGSCGCSSPVIERYRRKLSGPLLDRIDLQLWVPALTIRALNRGNSDNPTERLKSRVSLARQRQLERGPRLNSRLREREVREQCGLTPNSKKLLEAAGDKLRLSARGYTRTLRVARTIADLEDSAEIGDEHLLEALSYRLSN